MDDTAETGQRYTRADKHMGDFGEALVVYTLIRNGFEVATVDHVGADLIAECKGERYAISVKSRMYRANSVESRGVILGKSDLDKLVNFAQRFGLVPLFAHVCSIVEDEVIHVVIFPTSFAPDVMKQVQSGYRKDIRDLIEDDRVNHSCWREEKLDIRLFSRFA